MSSPYENLAILTERPVALDRDNLGRLHSGDGPALSYPDGWDLYAWRGMPIPPTVAAELPHLTVARIQAQHYLAQADDVPATVCLDR